MKENTALENVLQAYDFGEPVLEAVRYGQGHINDTFCVTCKSSKFILQGLSAAAFSHPEHVMENMVGITTYLTRQIVNQGGDPNRETLRVLKTKDGQDYYTDTNGKIWRLMPFIENVEVDKVTPELFEASAKAFGRFQYMLKDYPANTLHETIPHFHDTEDRYAKFEAAVEADKVGRCAGVAEEIQFAKARKADCSVVLQAMRDGKLPLRVTHNDTKLNNVLFDKETREGLCVIDLDTTMPGLAINDFGDSIRFGANHCAEDEKDLSKVNFDIDLFETYARGFLKGTKGSLTKEEIAYMPWGARLMTLECGIRFLTDYLDGDHYFHTAYPEHNLDRCRTQFKLVRDMENQFDEMKAVVERLSR